MNNILKICLVILLFLLVAPITQSVSAEDAFDSNLKTDFLNKLKIVGEAPGFNTSPDTDSAGVITNLIAYGMSLVAIIFLILIIWSGLQWMSSSGNEEKISEARKRMIRASVGLGITLGAFVITYTIYSFLSGQYLDTTGTEIGAPPGSQETIACEDDVDCEDRGTRIFCLNNSCVECRTNSDCALPVGVQGPPSRPGIPFGASECHPTWYVCMLPAGTECSSITDTGLCLASNCKWVVTGQGDHDTWATGQCFDESHACPQCDENTPVCAEINNQMSCLECVPDIARGACGALQWCSWNNTCFP